MPGRLRPVEISGPAALSDAAAWVERLHAELGISLLAGRRWLEAWTRAFPLWEPWVLTVLAGEDPVAVAPLMRRCARSGFEVVVIGAHELNESPVVTRNAPGATELAASLACALDSLGSPWSLRLPQLPSGSPLTAALREHLAPTIVEPGSQRPVMRLDCLRPSARLLSATTRSALAETFRAWSSGVLRARRSITRRLHSRGWLPGVV